MKLAPYILALALLVGCKTATPPTVALPGLPSATGNVARIDASAKAAKDAVDHVPWKLDQISSAWREYVQNLLDEIQTSASKAQNDITTAQTMADRVARQAEAYRIESRAELSKRDAKLAELDKAWIGPRGWRWIKIIIGGWAVLLIASVAFNFSGVGWLSLAGKGIRRFLPFSNPAGWAIDWIASRK